MKALYLLAALLALTGCQPKPQKFEIVSPAGNVNQVFRFDTETGQTWRYDHQDGKWWPVREP